MMGMSTTDKSNKMANTRQKGKNGEDQAAEWLERLGYRILERNWYCRRKEIDLIAMEGEELVVVEVKLRRAPMLERPEQAINREKQRSLVFAANSYVRMKHIRAEVRFDVIFVIGYPDRDEILHIRRAFYPSW